MVKNDDLSLPDSLKTQLTKFIGDLKAYNAKREYPRPEKDYRFLHDFYTRFFADRNKRADEVISSDYSRVKEIANAQFPATTLWNLCMDGRVLAVLINGASAGVGSSIRVPGGILREFVYGTNGKLTLIENSNFAFIMRRALKRFKTKKIFEVYDSHVGCAARKGEEMSHGKIPEDAGLLADVIYKKQMAEATIAFVQKHFSDSIWIVPIQTSFDPHSGFMYMGLETDAALAYAQEHGGEYTEEVIRELVEKERILSTEYLISQTGLENIFKKYVFPLEWQKKYSESARIFWENIEAFKNDAMPLFTKAVLTVYPHLKTENPEMQDELKERALLLLTNAYSGYLHNKQHIGTGTESNERYRYPYGVHREEGIKVSEGGYPPYEISMFVVFSLDIKNLPANIELAAGLVRSNRREKRVYDRSETYKSTEEFVEAPVPVVVQEIIREKVTDEEWEELGKVEWKDLPHNWNTLSDKEFFTYLQRKTNMSIAVANGINRLRERMAFLYDPEHPTSGHLVQQYKVALPVVVGINRKNYFIIPFVKLGFPE